jgi:biotin carboxyl carrier protein
MIFEVAIGDRVRTVSVVRKGAVLHVTLDGHTHVVDARRVSDSALSLLVQNGTGGLPVQSIDASFAAPGPGGDFDVHLAGRTVPVLVRPSTVMTRQGASSALKAGQAGGAGPQRVVSPMPGKIVRVLVKAGDHVTAKQGLVVVEAMKMENELRAARDGRVRELSVAEGQSVDAGTLLLVVA